MSKKAAKKVVSLEIDKLTNSIENAVSGEIFETAFSKVIKSDIINRNWLFDWNSELKDKGNVVYKMTTVENRNIIHGLISIKIKENYVFVNLVENAMFNRGKDKMYIGVGGNLFAFACKISKDIGFEGYVAFDAKTKLINHYHTTLGAERALGQRMYISGENAVVLIAHYFKNQLI